MVKGWKEFEKFQDVRIVKGKHTGAIGFIDKKHFNWNPFARKKEPKYDVWIKSLKTKSGYKSAFSPVGQIGHSIFGGRGWSGGIMSDIPASHLGRRKKRGKKK